MAVKLASAVLALSGQVGNGTGGGLMTVVVVDGITINAPNMIAPANSVAANWSTAFAAAINASTTLVNGSKVTAVPAGGNVVVNAVITDTNNSWLNVTITTGNGNAGNLSTSAGAWTYGVMANPYVPATAKMATNAQVASMVAAALSHIKTQGL